jgi:Lrp/AsnC family transcriptional regulator
MDVYRMAGDVDYLLRAAVGSMAEYDALYRTLIAALPLKKVTSRFAMERVKSSTAYPIAPSTATGRGAAAAA